MQGIRKTRGSIYAETRWDEHGFSELDQKVSAASTRASSPGSMERQGGFTLIELLLCIAIVGLLASVAYPMYTEHLRETRVADGRALLMTTASSLERCYSRDQAYDIAACDGLERPSESGFYQLSVERHPGRYFLEARAVDAQSVKEGCDSLTMDQTGERAPDDCW